MISDLDLEQELKLIIPKLDQRYTYLSSLLQTHTWQAFHHHLLNLPNICETLRNRQTLIYSTMAESIAFLINHKFIRLVPERIQLAPLIPIFHLLKKDVHFTPKYEWLHERFSDIVQFYQYLNFEEYFEDIDDKNKKLRDDFLKNSIEALYSETPNKESYAYKPLQALTQDQKNIFEIIAVNTYFKFALKGQDQSKKDIIFDKFVSSSNPLVLLQLLNLQSIRMEQVRQSICKLKLQKKGEKWELQGQCKVEKIYLTSDILFKAITSSPLIYRHLAQNFFVSTQKQMIFKYQISRILRQADFNKEEFFNTITKIRRQTDYSQAKTDFQSIITSSFAIIEGILSGKTMWEFANNQLMKFSHDKAIILALKMMTYLFRTKFTFEFDLQHTWDDKPTINFEINQDQLREALSKIIQYCINSAQKMNDAIINGIIEMIRWFQESKEHCGIIQSVFSKQSEKEISTLFLSLMVRYMSKAKSDRKIPYNVGIWIVKNVKNELLGENTPFLQSLYSEIYTFLIENHRYHNIVSLELDKINFEPSYKVKYYKMVQQFLDNNPEFITCIMDKWISELQYFQTDGKYFRKDRKYRLALLAILFNHKSLPLNEEIKSRLKRLLGMEDMRPKEQYKYIWQAFLKKIQFDVPSEFDFAISQLQRHTQDPQILANNYRAISYRLINPQCLRDLTKAITRFYFILGTTEPIPTEPQAMQLVEIMLNFTQIQSNYHKRLQEASHEYSEAELEWLQSLSNHSFGGFCDDLLEKFSRIKSFLTEKVSSLVINNRIIIRLGARIGFLMEKTDNVRLIHVTLNTISRFIRDKSSKLQCELFLQLYNHHKETIITLLQTLFENHALTFECEEEPSCKENQADFALQLLKEGKNVKQGWQKQNKELLQYSIKRLVGEIFSNENWQYSVLLNNIKYEKANNLKLFEKTIQTDLTTRLVTSFHPQKISFYQKLFKMIDDCYHRRHRDDLQCSQTPLAIQPPTQPLTLITKIADLEKLYLIYEKFILKLFEHWQAFESSESFQKLYHILLSELQDEAKVKLQKQILNQLIKSLFGILVEIPLTWNRYQKMHLYINTVVDSFNDPIGSLLSQELVEAYFARFYECLSKKKFTTQNSKPFVQFVERLVPDSKPEVFDARFEEYTKHSLQACIQLVKLVKVEEVESTLVSLMAKIIRMRETCFDNALINLFKSVEGITDTFSQLFCELAEKHLRQASIEQEIKCFFFRLHQQNHGKEENNRQRVKLSQFAQIFSSKYKPHKKQMIQVAQRLTHKMTVKQEAQKSKYLIYNQDLKFDHSIFLGKDFIENRPSEQLRTILSSFIKGIQVTDSDKLGKQLKQLGVISFSYPILTAYILMHPKKHGDITVPFVDYLLDAFCNNNIEEDSYGIFAYFSLDVGLIFTYNKKSIYFSQYICHRMLSRLIEGELTNRKLLMVYFLAKTKRFADMCFRKLKESKSMCDLLWDKLSSFRQGETYSSHLSVLIYGILVLLYRENNVDGLNQFCEYWRNDDWEDYNSIVNVNWLPFKHMRVKGTTKDDEIFKVSKDYQIQNTELYEHFQTKYPQWYDKAEQKQQQPTKENPTSTQAQRENKQQTKQPKQPQQPIQPQPIVQSDVKVSSQGLKHLGSLAQTHASDYRDIQSLISTNYFNQHRSAFQIFHIYFLEHPNDNTMQRKRRRNKDASYILFDELEEDSNQPSQSSRNELREEEFNANQQSPFAPEEFARVRQPQQEEDAKIDDFQKELQAKLTEISGGNTMQDQIIEEHIEQFTIEMMDIFNIINERLAQLQRPLIVLSDIQGKTQQQKLQYLQGKQLQSDFDVKQATMTIQQFQSYCLGNVSRLERLGSERRNVVRYMEDAMLMRFVQRSISSDSVDYIIDTIDENYQLLPNVLPHRMSVAGEEALPNKPKSDADIRYIKSANIPAENFEDISQQRLYELILMALYYHCGLISTKNFPPFFENKRIQSKLVNTLLYIYQVPFQNPHFPKKHHRLDLQNLKWQQEGNQQTAANEIRERIADIFMSGKTSAFYQDNSYLNEQIDCRGIKGIIYEPSNKSAQGSEKYKPINEVLELILTAEIKKLADEQQQHEFGYVFSLFNGMSNLLQSQLQKLLSFLKEVHKNIKQRLSNQSESADDDDIYRIMNQEQTYNITTNFKALLERQKIRNAIRNAFPLDAQETDPFFVLLFMNSNVYPREQLLKLHRKVIQKDVANSSNVYFSNMVFKLYTEEQLHECSWVKQSKNILPCIVKALPKRNNKLKEQPFYRLCAYHDYLFLSCKSQILYRKVKQYQEDLNFSGSDDVVAQRKKGIFQSAFLDLRNKPDGFWYQNFSVKFMNEAGKLQSGYGRGVAKDWYAYVTKGMANLNYGIFMKTGKNYYFFNRQSWINPRHLQFLQFIGKLFALAIVNREFYLAPSFSILIYKMILGEKIEITDIAKQFDQGEVIRNIQKLREYHDDSLFCQSFVYQDKRLISNRNLEILRRKRSMEAADMSMKEGTLYLLQEAVELKEETEETPAQKEELSLQEEQAPKMIKVLKIGESLQLLPGGAQIPVNKDNLQQFITLTKQKIYDIIVKGVQQQFNAFMAGFRRVVKPDFIKNISAEELREIAQGCDKISVEDLKKYVTVGRGVNENSIAWFWECIEALSARERMYLIQHWTGLPKVSAEGFKNTNLNIVRGSYAGRLFAQTCFNKLHMPAFQTKEKLEEAVRMAINSVKVGESIIED